MNERIEATRRSLKSDMLKGLWIIWLATVIWPGIACAETREIHQIFGSANQLYSQGDYKGAIEQYETIVHRHFVNPSVYYNLANAYFKDNQLGKAILYYEKASRLAPRDREIVENLNFARSRIADKVEKPDEGLLVPFLRRWATWVPLDLETSLVVGFFLVANLCFSVFWWGSLTTLVRPALYGALVFFALSLLLGASNVFRIYADETTHEGVVLVEKADVLSGPAGDNPTLFSIHEGLKVRVENELQDWVQISLENGWNGWLRKESLGMI